MTESETREAYIAALERENAELREQLTKTRRRLEFYVRQASE